MQLQFLLARKFGDPAKPDLAPIWGGQYDVGAQQPGRQHNAWTWENG